MSSGIRAAGPRTYNVIRDGVAGALLALGLLLPWNLSFGFGTGSTTTWVYVLVVAATLLAAAGLIVGRLSPRVTSLPLLLSLPYLVLVACFVAFAVVEAFRHGGTGAVPPGIGPGVLAGLAGAVLAARNSTTPVVGDRPTTVATRCIGIASLTLAAVAVLWNLYWRTHFLIPAIGNADTGGKSAVIVTGTLIYGLAAAVPVIIAARWILSADGAARLATLLLGASSLIAVVLVWLLPLGRDLDSFHGIVQNTSTAGVGFEGYLAWVSVAALVATPAAIAAYGRQSGWSDAIRKCLVLIAASCACTAVQRVFDLISNSTLDLPAVPYNSTTLMAFDIVTAVLAIWLFLNAFRRATPRLTTLLLGLLFTLTVSRLILGVALIPRNKPLDSTDAHPIYGNTLSQQITSTFDVTLCVLALALVAISLATVTRRSTTRPVPTPAPVHPTPPVPTASAPVMAGTAPPAIRVAAPAPATKADRVAEVLAESTRRFAAGTTYGAPEQSAPNQRTE